MKYWEIEFKCDESWSVSGVYSFYMKQVNKPNVADIKRVHGISEGTCGLGNIVRIIEISEDEYEER